MTLLAKNVQFKKQEKIRKLGEIALNMKQKKSLWEYSTTVDTMQIIKRMNKKGMQKIVHTV